MSVSSEEGVVVELTSEEARAIVEIFERETENPAAPHSKEFCSCEMCRMKMSLRERLERGGERR